MKARFLFLAIALIFVFAATGDVYAQAIEGNDFHKAGSLDCTACHSIHFSEDGSAPEDSGGTPFTGPNNSLLYEANVTDSCMACHNVGGANADVVYGTGTAPKVQGTATELPGGEFDGVIATAANGHSLGGTGWDLEGALTAAPGGTYNYTQADFHCTACHDPHGDLSVANAYRNLLLNPNGVGGSVTLTSNDADEQWLRTAAASTDANVAASSGNSNVYEDDFGAWCGDCHDDTDDGGGFHGAAENEADMGGQGAGSGIWRRHPTNTALTADYVSNYATALTTYNATYPVIRTGDRTTAWAAVTTAEKVFCLSCHNAHGSTFANATKWDATGSTSATTGCGTCHGR